MAEIKYNKEKRGWFQEGHSPDMYYYDVRTAQIKESYFGLRDYRESSLGLHMTLKSSRGDSLFHMYEENDIRELFSHDLEYLRNATVI